MDHLHRYLNNIQAEYIMGGYLKCRRDWCDYDYTPSYNKFYFIRGGECELVIGERVIRPKAGQLILMPAGVKQSYYNISDNCVEKYWCHFYADLNGTNLFDVVKTDYCVDIDDCASLERLFSTLLRTGAGETVASIFACKGALLDIIARFIEKSGADRVEPFHREGAPDFTPVLSFIEHNLGRNITVSSLAEIMHLHPNYFISTFKSHFGCPPKRYIMKIRIEKAKKLLRTTDDPVSEVACAIGINDIFYFSRIFKKETGFSPSTFRGYRI